MAEQTRDSGPLSAAVADVASGVALALGEGGSYALSRVLARDDPVALAAIRVLGADVLAPYALDGRQGARDGRDESVVRRALAAYPPGADASDVSVWSYRGLVEASRAYLPGTWPAQPRAGDDWVRTDPWPKLSHHASQLAALSLPGLAPALADALAARTEDLARGFVRAVRRRDWLQAAGIGRWLAGSPDTPESLGLDSGLAFVRRMGEGDARVALHLAAAQRFHGRGW
ncbi:hypothetical protein [Streptomyces sp. HPF1205]|uniref:hypothetical protein n=1 Tax=Streptomyces sp. HPF1205 TaxID=2873262 RepID=UPI001CED7842|nr:hypothetical protein [Streptomyces sp. HPF1205]